MIRLLIKLLLNNLLVLFFFSCVGSTDLGRLENDVLNNIKENYANDGIEPKSLTLEKIADNTFTGTLTTIEDGYSFSYEISVITIGDSFQWEITSEGEVSSNSISENIEVESNEHYNHECNDCNGSGIITCSMCNGTGINNMGMDCGCVTYVINCRNLGINPTRTALQWTCNNCKGTGFKK